MSLNAIEKLKALTQQLKRHSTAMKFTHHTHVFLKEHAHHTSLVKMYQLIKYYSSNQSCLTTYNESKNRSASVLQFIQQH